jgi:uncharacterized tellurite resistance protein B-like protein
VSFVWYGAVFRLEATMHSDVSQMSAETRMDLVKLACVAAWSDFEVVEEERRFVLQLATDLALDVDEVLEVETWLKGPPPEFDPNAIAPEHKKAFVEALMGAVMADGRIDPEECLTMALIRDMLT